MNEINHGLTASEIHAILDIDNPVMLEIGCNDGTDTESFLTEFPGVHLHCFDPDPRPLSRFVRGPCVGIKQCTLTIAAMSDVDGFAEFHLSGGKPPRGQHPKEAAQDWDLSSSLSKPTGHLDYSPWCTFDRKIIVPTLRLDTWYATKPDVDRIDFIWADVQGAEEKLIKGGKRTLLNTAWFYTEFYDSPMYAGQPNLRRIDELLPGFELVATYDRYNALFRNKRWT